MFTLLKTKQNQLANKETNQPINRRFGSKILEKFTTTRTG